MTKEEFTKFKQDLKKFKQTMELNPAPDIPQELQSSPDGKAALFIIQNMQSIERSLAILNIALSTKPLKSFEQELSRLNLSKEERNALEKNKPIFIEKKLAELNQLFCFSPPIVGEESSKMAIHYANHYLGGFEKLDVSKLPEKNDWILKAGGTTDATIVQFNTLKQTQKTVGPIVKQVNQQYHTPAISIPIAQVVSAQKPVVVQAEPFSGGQFEMLLTEEKRLQDKSTEITTRIDVLKNLKELFAVSYEFYTEEFQPKKQERDALSRHVEQLNSLLTQMDNIPHKETNMLAMLNKLTNQNFTSMHEALASKYCDSFSPNLKKTLSNYVEPPTSMLDFFNTKSPTFKALQEALSSELVNKNEKLTNVQQSLQSREGFLNGILVQRIQNVSDLTRATEEKRKLIEQEKQVQGAIKTELGLNSNDHDHPISSGPLVSSLPASNEKGTHYEVLRGELNKRLASSSENSDTIEAPIPLLHTQQLMKIVELIKNTDSSIMPAIEKDINAFYETQKNGLEATLSLNEDNKALDISDEIGNMLTLAKADLENPMDTPEERLVKQDSYAQIFRHTAYLAQLDTTKSLTPQEGQKIQTHLENCQKLIDSKPPVFSAVVSAMKEIVKETKQAFNLEESTQRAQQSISPSEKNP